MPEREPHPGAFLALETLIRVLEIPDIWPAVYVRYEAGLLQDLGFGLDLSKCAATGDVDDLVYVSPRTGRAVSRKAGAPYHDKLLPLPPLPPNMSTRSWASCLSSLNKWPSRPSCTSSEGE